MIFQKTGLEYDANESGHKRIRFFESLNETDLDNKTTASSSVNRTETTPLVKIKGTTVRQTGKKSTESQDSSTEQIVQQKTDEPKKKGVGKVVYILIVVAIVFCILVVIGLIW